MDRERIEQIMKKLDNLLYKFTDNEVIIACYISIRYGTSNFENYIDSIDLDKIFKEISKCNTLFDEQLNYKIDRILSEKTINEKINGLDKQKIVTAFEEVGDSAGLDEIQQQLESLNNVDKDVKELLECIYKLNYIIIETETQDYASKYNVEIQEIYSKMKDDLFTRLDIKFEE